uniref:UBC core domain-containing protein n=1 Tax=Panagrolaimus sp. JU765 TaxID=591449 RepID=A0AC34QI53_9BILA
MACIQKLKEDLIVLERLFPKGHERVQIISASLDEVVLKFVKPDSTSYDFTGSILENYPRVAPLWFTDSEDPSITAIINEMSDNHQTPGMLHQIHYLISQLCALNQLTVPAELLQMIPNQELDEGTGSDDEMEFAQSENEEEDDVEMFEDMADDSAAFEDAGSSTTGSTSEDLPSEAVNVLNRVVVAQRQQHLRGTPTGSIAANDRLMKELKDIYRCENMKNGTFSVELVNDNLYEWDVYLQKVDEESLLAQDLKQLSKEKKPAFLQFKFHFKDTFPFEPPFVHLIAPTVQNGFVLSGGALCMELLTKQGWSSAYSIESLIMQIAATLVKGKARVAFDGKANTYSFSRAQQSFKSLVHIHSKSGWYTPPQADG